MTSKPPPDPETIERKLESLRPGAEPEPLDRGEVTGVIDLALERLQVAQEATTGALDGVCKRMQAETARAIAFARRLSLPPTKP